MIRVMRISHTVFETPDLARQVEYYSHVIGFHVLSQTSTQAFLGSRVGQEVIGFEAGSSNQCRRIEFQVAPDFDHERIGAELRPFAIKHEGRSDISPSIARATAFVDLKGTEIELFHDQSEVPIPRAGVGIGPLKLGHIAFSVPSAPAITKFYVDALSFRISDWIEDMFAFLRCGPDHHSVNFLTGSTTFMNNIDYELKD